MHWFGDSAVCDRCLPDIGELALEKHDGDISSFATARSRTLGNITAVYGPYYCVDIV